MDIAAAYSTTNWGAFIAPFFVGMIADRFFSAQKVLGVLHLVGAGLLYCASTIQQPGPFFWALLAYALLYMPTLALVNAISFHQMKDPGTQFPGIRVLGTIGWIVAGILVGKILKPWNAADRSHRRPHADRRRAPRWCWACTASPCPTRRPSPPARRSPSGTCWAWTRWP